MINMGIGEVGGANVLHKRKFRWTFELTREGDTIVPVHYVKLAARPNISIEETEINFLNGKTWIPGKGTWETVTITYYDVSVDGGQGNIGLWNWLATVYDFTNPVTLTQSTRRDNYSCDATCTLYDGCGTALEAWGMGDAWPTAVNFGELDYATSEECTVEVTMRYANVSYANFCGPDVAPECEGCSGG